MHYLQPIKLWSNICLPVGVMFYNSSDMHVWEWLKMSFGLCMGTPQTMLIPTYWPTTQGAWVSDMCSSARVHCLGSVWLSLLSRTGIIFRGCRYHPEYAQSFGLNYQVGIILVQWLKFVYNYHITCTYRPNWVKIYGEHFEKHSFVHCGWQDDLPVFARILKILIASNFPLLNVLHRKAKFPRYCVKRTQNLDVLYMAHLENKYPLEAHTYLDDLYCTAITNFQRNLLFVNMIIKSQNNIANHKKTTTWSM